MNDKKILDELFKWNHQIKNVIYFFISLIHSKLSKIKECLRIFNNLNFKELFFLIIRKWNFMILIRISQ